MGGVEGEGARAVLALARCRFPGEAATPLPHRKGSRVSSLVQLQRWLVLALRCPQVRPGGEGPARGGVRGGVEGGWRRSQADDGGIAADPERSGGIPSQE